MVAASIGLPSSAQLVRAVTAAVIGNVLEWNAFGVYGFVAVILAWNFFPGKDEISTLVSDGHLVDEHAIEPVEWAVREFVLVHSLLGRTTHRHLARLSLA